MKAYPAYKESGVDWIGKLPHHWEVIPLKHTSIINRQALTEQTEEDYEIQYIDIGNVNHRGIINPPQEMHFADAPSRARRIIQQNDTIISTVRTYLKAVAFVESDEENLIASTGFATLTPNQKSYPKFLNYLVSSQGFVDTVTASSVGVSYPAITSTELARIPVWLPPLPEQRAIADFLDRKTRQIDTLIEKKQRQIELLQEQRTALINQAVTKGLPPSPDRRGAGGEVPMKDSGIEWLGEIPRGWSVAKLKFLASIMRGKFSHRPRNDPAFYDGSYPFIQTGDVAGVEKYITTYHQTLNELGYTVSKEFPKGTLVMTIAANIGDIAILDFQACFPDSIVGFVPNDGVSTNYLYYNLRALKQEFLKTSTVNTQLNINVERIGDQYSVRPPIEEQEAISKYLDEMIEKIIKATKKLQREIELLGEYRTALISAAVTGKIDVREW
jgi:type I restriction enzyme, S subunit